MKVNMRFSYKKIFNVGIHKIKFQRYNAITRRHLPSALSGIARRTINKEMIAEWQCFFLPIWCGFGILAVSLLSSKRLLYLV